MRNFFNLNLTVNIPTDVIAGKGQPRNALGKSSFAMPSTSLPTSRSFLTQLLNSLSSLPQHVDVDTTSSNPLSSVPNAAKKQLLSLQVLFPNEFVPALDLLDRRLVTRFRLPGAHPRESEAAAESQRPPPPPHAEDARNLADSVAQPSNDHTAAFAQQNGSHVEQSVANASPSHIAVSNVPCAPPSPQSEDQIMSDITTADNQPAIHPHNQYNTVYYVRSAQHRTSRFTTSFDTTTSYQVRLHAWNCSCPAFAFAAFPALHPEPSIAAYEAGEDDGRWVDDNTTSEIKCEWSFGGVSLGNGMPPVCKHLLACVLADKCSGIFGAFVEERHVSVDEAAGWAAGWGD